MSNLVGLITALNVLVFRYGWYMTLVLTLGLEKFISVKNDNDTRIAPFDTGTDFWVKLKTSRAATTCLFEAADTLVLYCGRTLAWSFIVYRGRAGQATVGDVIAFTGRRGLLMYPVMFLSPDTSSKIDMLINANQLRRIIAIESGMNEAGSRLEVRRDGDIDLRNDIQTVKISSVLERTGLIPQSLFVFNATVRHNVAYGNQGATDEQVHEAFQCADIHDIIMSRTNEDQAAMGNNGTNFSGGEHQRLKLGRLFLKDPRPDIVLIDDATSALDAESEAFTRESMRKEFSGKTVIIIA
ncbi:hypothetical protein AYL99_11783 [Fonsecaea erecta]|uniref:ABC transporter domain-containing protein n=1 Tax=Fonsecaea erecta TaxID=1367422 RepID=A0A178Z499_9EURO|nr:hypothetical protein AYL99_11783 [Fonsecaea erecta]OAP54023.1 hypothetical protein AYL99_11783 [Fonsecaea erecta]